MKAKRHMHQFSSFYRIAVIAMTIAFGCTGLCGAEPAVPAVPEALVPLKAKLANGSYSFKGLYLNFRADQPVTEEQWKAIEGLGVKGIGVGGKGIDDEAIARIAKLDLQTLSLDGAEAITDASCKSLAKMKSLRRLSMGHMLQKGFTGKDLSLLKDLPSLEALTLAGSATGDEAMAAIGQITQLKELANWHTRHSDPKNAYLLNLTNLKSLTLGRNGATIDHKSRQALTDATIDTLIQLKSLEQLRLWEARLTLPALLKLKALSNLKSLGIENVDLSPEEVEKLKRELAGVDVRVKPLTDADRKRLAAVFKGE